MVALPKPEDAAGWYDLIKMIVSDIRGEKHKIEAARTATYAKLMEALTFIHDDYVKMLVDFENALPASGREASVGLAKEQFLQSRRARSTERLLAVLDARALQDVTADPRSHAFLVAAARYVTAKEGKEKNEVTSMSRDFSELISDVYEAEVLRTMTFAALGQVEARYRSLVSSYTPLDPTYVLGGSRRYGEAGR